ncbi:MAG: GTP-binding protein, partial [Gemmatimonadaceae bacterium]
MREYRSEDIRNIALVGHGGSGKTTLTDALVHAAGGSGRHGAIRDGTTLTDHSDEEIQRGYSIHLGCAHAEWDDAKLNFIDTPGFLDFLGDAVAGLAAADGALVCVGATTGVEVGTEVMFNEAVERRDPVLFVVTMMDRDFADFDQVYQQIREQLTTRVVPVEIPLGQGAGFRGVMNLFTGKAYVYDGNGRAGDAVEQEIPADERANFDRYREALIEAISATDDGLLERYLEGAEIGRDEAIAGMKEAMKRADLFPIFCVAATSMVGVRALLTEVVQLMPSAYEMEEVHA